MRRLRGQPANPTRSQLQIIEAYTRLGSQKAVAAELGIALQTVKNQLADLYVRMNVGGAMEAIQALGWVHANVHGAPPCGWLAYCGRPEGHTGTHGGFRPFLRRVAA